MEARTIPLVEVGTAGAGGLVDAAPERLAEIMAMARHRYGRLGLRLGDGLSRRWLERTANPFLDEISGAARRIDGHGTFLLNLSYEWTCTTGIGADPAGAGNRMLRTLDWPLDGLGRTVVVARQEGPAGAYYNVTWPGFAGITTAMAPGRFSAALNQPPMRRLLPSCHLDWALSRVALWRGRGLPPSHLLRHVFDTCRTFDEALEMLSDTPLCLPVFYALSGVGPEQGCIIERREHEAARHQTPF